MDDAPRHLQRIRDALDAQDGDALRRAAHGLKGAAANFDADAVVTIARTLEERGGASAFGDHERLWGELTTEMDRLILALRAFAASV